jgi:hypothetical protein
MWPQDGQQVSSCLQVFLVLSRALVRPMGKLETIIDKAFYYALWGHFREANKKTKS